MARLEQRNDPDGRGSYAIFETRPRGQELAITLFDGATDEHSHLVFSLEEVEQIRDFLNANVTYGARIET